MAAALSRLSGTGGSADLLLGALASLKAGDAPSARTTLLGLASQTGDSDLALRALWVLYAAALSNGDASGQSTFRGRLTSRFPSAPEAALAAGRVSQAVLAPGPDALAPGEASSTPPASPAGGTATAAQSATEPTQPPAVVQPAQPATQPPTAQPAASAAQPAVPAATQRVSPSFSVQAGSFQMKENSDDLVAELTKRGFTPVVVEESAQGKHRFRVLAAAGLPPDQAKAVLLKLSQAGFSGFLVTDK